MEKTNLLTRAKKIIIDTAKETKSIIVDYASKILEKEIRQVTNQRDYEELPEKFVITESGTHRFKTEEELRGFIDTNQKVIPIGTSIMVWRALNEKRMFGSIKQTKLIREDMQDVYIAISEWGDQEACAPNEQRLKQLLKHSKQK